MAKPNTQENLRLWGEVSCSGFHSPEEQEMGIEPPVIHWDVGLNLLQKGVIGEVRRGREWQRRASKELQKQGRVKEVGRWQNGEGAVEWISGWQTCLLFLALAERCDPATVWRGKCVRLQMYLMSGKGLILWSCRRGIYTRFSTRMSYSIYTPCVCLCECVSVCTLVYKARAGWFMAPVPIADLCSVLFGFCGRRGEWPGTGAVCAGAGWQWDQGLAQSERVDCVNMLWKRLVLKRSRSSDLPEPRPAPWRHPPTVFRKSMKIYACLGSAVCSR